MRIQDPLAVVFALTCLSCTPEGSIDSPLPGAPSFDETPAEAGLAEVGLAAAGGPETSPSDTDAGEAAVNGTHEDLMPCIDQGWSGDDLKTIENDKIKIGFKRSVGATITFAAEKPGLRNLVNDNQISDARAGDPRVGTTFSDKGRQWQFGSDYFTPGNAWKVSGKSTADYGFDTGGNVVQGGSLGNYYDESPVLASAIVDDPKRGKVFCAKVRPRVWGVPGVLGHIVLEEEIWLEGNTIAYKIKHTVGPRDDAQTTWESREQENPCLYVIAPLTTHRAVVGKPFVGTPAVDRFPKGWNGSNSVFSPTLLTSECWIGAYEGEGGKGVTYYSPMNCAVRSAQFGPDKGDWSSNASSYINAAPMMNYDTPAVYRDYGFIILGTQAEARAKIDTLPRPDPSFDFDFSDDAQRWFNGNCSVKREGGELVVHLGDQNQDGARLCTFAAPYRAWSADSFHAIELTMAVSGATRLRLLWQRPGETHVSEGKEFEVKGDGLMRTYVVSTEHAAWNGVISTVGIQAVNDPAVTPDDARIVVKHVRRL